MFELDVLIVWVSWEAELENKQICKETVAVYVLVGVWDSGVGVVPIESGEDSVRKECKAGGLAVRHNVPPDPQSTGSCRERWDLPP
jgi:hypothetical protein